MSGLYSVKKTLRLALAGSVCAFALTAGAAMAETKDFNVPAGDLRVALDTYIRQSGAQVLYRSEDVGGRTSPGAKGNLSPEEALAQILKDANLVVTRSPAGALMIAKAPQGEAAQGAASQTGDDIVEVVVTGTHIRGANPAVPVHTVTREDIENSGYAEIGEVMRSLPENFSGGQNPGVIGASSVDATQQNVTNSSTANLRGLGPDATLVLLNGHRMAPDSIYGGVDISVIPLSAIRRVDVVSDGSSSLYGADAVGGVINFVLRRDYSGLETSVRFGGATQGGGFEQTYNVLAGTSKERWYALANLEYSDQEGVVASQRGFTSNVTPQTTLMRPSQKRTLFLSAGADIGQNAKLSFDGIFNDRTAQEYSRLTPTSTTNIRTYYTPSFNAALTLDVDLPRNWQLHVTGVNSGTRNVGRVYGYRVGASTPTITPAYNRTAAQYVEVTADGDVFQLPGGMAKAAVGGGYRTDFIKYGYPGPAVSFEATRDASYIFGELSLPLISPLNARPGIEALEINFSARYESYNDFGETTTPKVAVRYKPINDLAFRATWGKSFKPPRLHESYQQTQLYIFNATTFGYTGGGTALMVYGGNEALKPEKSESWTFGADYTAAHYNNLKLSITLFGIDYADRVVIPISPASQGLSNPLFAPFVDWTPTVEEQQYYFSIADVVTNFTSSAYNPASIVAILRDQVINAASQKISGVDLTYRQVFTLPKGNLSTFANASWLETRQRTIATQPDREVTGLIFFPTEFKSRGGVTWQSGGFSATGIVNYISGATDNGVTPNARISSWTTVDTNLTYNFASSSGVAKGLKVSLSASNLFDKDPPRTVSSNTGYRGMYFDSTNTSAIGRFVRLGATKAW